MTARPPRSPLFPYTTLFRSAVKIWRDARNPVGVSSVPAAMPIVSRPSRSQKRLPPHSAQRSEEHTSELQSRQYLVCRLLLENKKEGDELRVLSVDDQQPDAP